MQKEYIKKSLQNRLFNMNDNKEQDLKFLNKQVLKQERLLRNNPVKLSREDMAAIYYSAFKNDLPG